MVERRARICSRAASGALSLILLFSLLVARSQATDYLVGGPSQRWGFPPDTAWYENVWAKNYTFRVGDNLIFSYTSGLHNVQELGNQSDYDACNLNAIRTYGSGNDVVLLNATGFYYFVCGVLGHCANKNVKLKLLVAQNDTSGTNGSGLPMPPGGFGLGPIVGPIASTVLILLVAGTAYWVCRRKRKRSRQLVHKAPLIPMASLGKDGPRVFTFKELGAATKNFNRSELLGRGGFGSVYKGVLRDSGKSVVAVKSIAKDSRQGECEFLAEVSIIGQIRHRNLVRLRGWCAEREKLLVVYDYMPNGSLDKWLLPEAGQTPPPALLPWNARYNILSGISAALAYLHEEWQKCILHRDVKPSNILLDTHFNAYLGDFGMARLIDHNKVAYSTVVAGTMGYLAPELPHTRKATPKTDVFSFGVLALEVSCGRRAFDPTLPQAEVYLLDWVWSMHQSDQLRDVVDPRLKGTDGAGFDVPKQSKLVLQLALLACHPDPASRPSMRFIRQVLVGDLPLPPIPRSRPVISYSWSSTTLQPPTKEAATPVDLHVVQQSGNVAGDPKLGLQPVSENSQPQSFYSATCTQLVAALESGK